MTLLGIDIGGTRIKAGLVDQDGKVLAHQATATLADPDSFKEALRGAVSKLLASGQVPTGVGIGCKGVINPANCEVEALVGPLQFLEGSRLSDLIADLLPADTLMRADNDALAALAGEIVWGAARGRRNVVMLTLGTGVGGGVLAEGQILRGAGRVAGHLGHITVEVDGVVCSCGNRGCLETVFSARAIEAEALHAVHRGCESRLSEQFAARPEALTCRAVFELAAEGDELARFIRDRAIERLGAGLAGLLHAFDPEIAIVGGQISEAGAALFEPLQQAIGWRTRRLLRREVPIVPPGVTDASGVVGAAALAVQR